MARINQFEALCDELHREAVKKGMAVKKVVRKSTLTKSAPGSLAEFFAKAQAAGGKVTIREKGVKTGDKVLVKGKEAVTAKPKADPGANAVPKEHVGLRVARAIGDMKAHAMGTDLNGPVTEQQLHACHLLARTGKMTMEEVADVEKALNDKRALPSYILRKLGSGNA